MDLKNKKYINTTHIDIEFNDINQIIPSNTIAHRDKDEIKKDFDNRMKTLIKQKELLNYEI